MRDLIYKAMPLYPCFESEQGILFLRFFNVSVIRIADLELPIRPFVFDPQTKAVFAEEDGVAFDAIPTLKGFQEVIDDALKADWSALGVKARPPILSWALVAHTLNGTLTPPVFKAWVNTIKSNWFDQAESLKRLRYELFDLNDNLEVRVN